MIDYDYRLDLAASRHMEGPDGECPFCGIPADREDYARTGRCKECRRHKAGKLYDRLTWHRRRARHDRRTLRAAILWRNLAGKRTWAMVVRERITSRARPGKGRK